MSAENKAIVRRWFDEVWNQGRVEAIDELFAQDGVAHGLGEDLHGPGGFKPFQAAFRAAFPDLRIEIHRLVSEGDLVAYDWSASGTHHGHLMGVAPTGRSARIGGMSIVRIRNGQIAEAWNVFDQLGLFEQLGAVQRPA
jgi:steroid delta-isomerase-like uncharacterized protein